MTMTLENTPPPPTSSSPQQDDNYDDDDDMKRMYGSIPQDGKCTLIRSLFSHCSYCSEDIGSGPSYFGFVKDKGIRCSKCNWVYCSQCVTTTANKTTITTTTNDDGGGNEEISESSNSSKNDPICQNCIDREKGCRVLTTTTTTTTTSGSKTIFLSKKITLIDSVIVVGSGIGGLAAALALKNRGVSFVKVLEKSTELRTAGGPINIQTNALRALLDIDPKVMKKVMETCAPMTDKGSFQTLEGIPLFTTTLNTTRESRWGNPEARSGIRGDLQKILYDRCIEVGVEVHFGVKVVDVTEENSKVTIKTTSSTASEGGGGDNGETVVEECAPQTFTADFCVAADGIWSNIRSKVFGSEACPDPIYAGYQMIVTVAPQKDFDQMSIDNWGEHWGVGHRFGHFRCGNGGTGMYYSRTCPEGTDSDKSQAEMKQILVDALKENGYTSKMQELGAAADPSFIYRYNIRYMPKELKHFVSKSCRVVLLGDAANGMPPNIGQGACMAMESASILSQCLVVSSSESSTIQEAMAKFEKRRLKRCHLIARQSKENGDIFQASNIVTATLRNKLFAYLGKQSDAEKQKGKVDELDLPDPFAYIYSYRLMSWDNDSELIAGST